MDKNSHMEIQNRLIALARGHRLRSARMLSGLSRNDFGGKIGISANTLTTWEAPRAQNTGLSSKGAKRVIAGLKKLGIDCGYDWLFNGIGTGLSVPNYAGIKVTTRFGTPEAEHEDSLSILHEAEFFKQLHPDAVVIVIMDDGLEPRYSPGNYVGGRWYAQEKLIEAAGHCCIIETEDGLTFSRFLSQIADDKTCTFSCTNPFTTVSLPVQYHVRVNRVAKIVWHRIAV